MQLLHFIWLCVLHLIQIIESENDNSTVMKWFLRDKFLFYIDTEPRFTSDETQTFCKENDMVFTIMKSEAFTLFDQIHEIYGNFSSFWTYGNQQYNLVDKTDTNSCYKLTVNDLYRKENCSTLMGLICKRRIAGATLRYKNGTKYEIGLSDVQEYCDPQTSKYDDVLDYCKINFFVMQL
ncbi:uncharacterized protein LOC135962542 [Calliphora vicina]|uniref:uncharacterized protein LOC135962542 n=1 Tax=Calliphora vicina TaxID=7373 RepID=UPI00325A4885